MEQTYSLWQQILASHTVLTMFGAFIVVVFMAFRPGSRPMHDDASQIIFRHEDAPIENGDVHKNTNRGAEGQS